VEKEVRAFGFSELRPMRQLEDENRRLTGLVADVTLEKHMLSEALRFLSSPYASRDGGI
jgi:putative transposase